MTHKVILALGLVLMVAPIHAVEEKVKYDEESYVANNLPEKSKQQYKQGNRLILEDKFKEALSIMETLAKEHPDFPGAHRGMAICYARLGKADPAVRAYKRYIELAPSAPDANKVREIVQVYERK